MQDKILFEKDNRKLKNPKHLEKNIFYFTKKYYLSQPETKGLIQI